MAYLAAYTGELELTTDCQSNEPPWPATAALPTGIGSLNELFIPGCGFSAALSSTRTKD